MSALDALQIYDGNEDIDLASSTKPTTQSKKYATFDLKFEMQTIKTDNKSKISKHVMSKHQTKNRLPEKQNSLDEYVHMNKRRRV